jgi:hypothetical protein
MSAADSGGWRARGLLFENCNCTLVCPGHIRFEQPCTHARCIGYWAIRIDEGEFRGEPLAGLKAIVAFDTPQRMLDGGWTEVFLIDEGATERQRGAAEAILGGHAGGPWAVLNRFVERRLPTQYRRIEFSEEGGVKRARIKDLFDAVVAPIRGRDRSRPVMFDNIFNQIHAPSQVLATGTTQYDDGVITIANVNTHGLYSHFEWVVE